MRVPVPGTSRPTVVGRGCEQAELSSSLAWQAGEAGMQVARGACSATGMRIETAAGRRSGILPIEHPAWRFYRLVP